MTPRPPSPLLFCCCFFKCLRPLGLASAPVCFSPEGCKLRDLSSPCMPGLRAWRRYYVAEGVRLYSQETWRMVMGDAGKEEVAKCAPQVGRGCKQQGS
jgi:hypothetical protein